MKITKSWTLRRLFRNGHFYCTKSGVIFNGKTNKRLAGALNGSGYSTTVLKSRPAGLACAVGYHQAIWVYFNGTIPPGWEINHRNGNKLDNRLANLELVTRSGNMKHAFANGLKRVDGEHSPTRKLTKRQVAKIREALELGVLQRIICKQFGVTATTVSNINTGVTWKESYESARL